MLENYSAPWTDLRRLFSPQDHAHTTFHYIADDVKMSINGVVHSNSLEQLQQEITTFAIAHPDFTYVIHNEIATETDAAVAWRLDASTLGGVRIDLTGTGPQPRTQDVYGATVFLARDNVISEVKHFFTRTPLFNAYFTIDLENFDRAATTPEAPRLRSVSS